MNSGSIYLLITLVHFISLITFLPIFYADLPRLQRQRTPFNVYSLAAIEHFWMLHFSINSRNGFGLSIYLRVSGFLSGKLNTTALCIPAPNFCACNYLYAMRQRKGDTRQRQWSHHLTGIFLREFFFVKPPKKNYKKLGRKWLSRDRMLAVE